MTLQVPFEQFVAAAARVTGVKQAYVTPHPSGTLATSADPARDALVIAVAEMPMAEARKRLTEQGIEVCDGVWSVDGEVELYDGGQEDAHVAGVAYRSGESQPGIWLDAFPHAPSHGQVLRSMFDELRSTGEVADVAFEEFVRLAEPTVVVVSPTEIRGFLEQKERSHSNGAS